MTATSGKTAQPLEGARDSVEASRGFDSWKSLEGWLRAPLRRWALPLGLAALIAGTRTFQVRELREAMGHPALGWKLFSYHFGLWSTWALLSLPFVAFAAWLQGRFGWLVFLAIQIPLSAGVGYAAVQYQPLLFEKVYGSEPSPRSGRYDLGPVDWRRGPPRPGGERRSDSGGERGALPSSASGEREASAEERPPSGARDAGEGRPQGGRSRRGSRDPRRRPEFQSMNYLRIPPEMAIYWVLLAIGAGLQSYVRTRAQDRRASDLELRTARLRGELAAAQVDSLRAQLHPHFLFNALHTVGGLVRAGEERSALESISALGHLLRTTLDKGEVQEVTVAEELDVIESYLAIERIRFGERLEVRVEAEPHTGSVFLPAMLLLPLVENAVRYGVEPRTEKGTVTVRVTRDAKRLALDVIDDGPGFPDDVLGTARERVRTGDTDARKHIGLANTRDRLSALYGEEQVCELSNPASGGARVHIEVPLVRTRLAPETDHGE